MIKMSVIKCRASIEEVQMLEHYSELLGETKSEIVRTALKEYFEKLEKENAKKQKEEAFKMELRKMIAGRQPAGYITVREYVDNIYRARGTYSPCMSAITAACKKGYFPNAYQEMPSRKWMIPYYLNEDGTRVVIGDYLI